MRWVQLFPMVGFVLAGCSTAPVRWASAAYVIERPPAYGEPAVGGGGPDCSRLAGPDLAASGPPEEAAPILAITAAPRTATHASESPPDPARAAFYEQVGKHTGSLAEFMAAVHPPETTPPVLDFTALPRALTIAVHRRGYRPADRLERVQVIVKAVNFRILDTQSGSTFDVADLGHLSEERSLSGSLAASPASGAAMSGAASRTESFERQLRQRFQDTDVTVSPRELRVYREGAVGRDLTGALSIQFSAAPVQPDAVTSRRVITAVTLNNLKTAGGVDTGVLRSIGASGAAAQPLYACAQLRYVERRVVAGQRFLDEARQRVVIAVGATPWEAFEVAPIQDLRPPLWRIVADGSTLGFRIDGEIVSDFLDRVTAEKVANWASRPGEARLGDARLVLGGAEFDRSRHGPLGVVLVREPRAKPPEVDPALAEPYRPPSFSGALE